MFEREKESEVHDISHTAVSGLRRALRVPHAYSIRPTDANSNPLDETVTELQQLPRLVWRKKKEDASSLARPRGEPQERTLQHLLLIV